MYSFIEQKIVFLTNPLQHALLIFFVYASFPEQDFFMISNSSTVKLDCLNISGSVRDDNNINDRSCLTSSNITSK